MAGKAHGHTSTRSKSCPSAATLGVTAVCPVESSGRATLPPLKARPINPTSDRVWTLSELELLHELQKPVCVLCPVIHDTPHKCAHSWLSQTQVSLLSHALYRSCPCLCRQGDLLIDCQVVFENADFLQRFGVPRAQADISAALQRLPQKDRAELESWVKRILLVNNSTSCFIKLAVFATVMC